MPPQQRRAVSSFNVTWTSSQERNLYEDHVSAFCGSHNQQSVGTPERNFAWLVPFSFCARLVSLSGLCSLPGCNSWSNTQICSAEDRSEIFHLGLYHQWWELHRCMEWYCSAQPNINLSTSPDKRYQLYW